jgi:hypothetical protein
MPQGAAGGGEDRGRGCGCGAAKWVEIAGAIGA